MLKVILLYRSNGYIVYTSELDMNNIIIVKKINTDTSDQMSNVKIRNK